MIITLFYNSIGDYLTRKDSFLLLYLIIAILQTLTGSAILLIIIDATILALPIGIVILQVIDVTIYSTVVSKTNLTNNSYILKIHFINTIYPYMHAVLSFKRYTQTFRAADD